MRQDLDIPVDAILPEATAILRQLGVPPGAWDVEEFLATAEDARVELCSLLAPAGVLAEVTREEFGEIYAGQGFNDPSTPLDLIFPRAERLALFAVTCGRPASDRIRDLFDDHDYPRGAALDAAASLAADRAAQVAQDAFAPALGSKAQVLRYSPGYCGWHVSGQKALFGYLGNRTAGVTLSASFMMHPIKSVSGVIIAGRPGIHDFTNDYPFCTACTGKECRGRIRALQTLPGKET